MTINDMIQHRVSKGHARSESAQKLFDEGFRNYRGESLAQWLHLNDYANETNAAEYAANQAAYEASL